MNEMLTDKDIKIINRRERGIGCNSSLFTQLGFIDIPHNLRILEVGFGEGVLARYLLEQGNKVYGVDIGLASIEGAIKDGFIYGHEKDGGKSACLLYLDASTERLPFIDDFFDQVYMLETLEHLSSPIHTVYEIKRVLKHGGKLILSFPPYEHAEYIIGHHGHVYPGLLEREHIERFFMQMYFSFEKRIKAGDNFVLYCYSNDKSSISEAVKVRRERGEDRRENQINVFEVVIGNYTEKELYGHLNKSPEWVNSKYTKVEGL